MAEFSPCTMSDILYQESMICTRVYMYSVYLQLLGHKGVGVDVFRCLTQCLVYTFSLHWYNTSDHQTVKSVCK